MVKKGRITDEEKFIIKGMQLEGKEVSEIAEFIGRGEKTVAKYMIDVDSLEVEEEEDEEEKVQPLTVNQTNGKGDGGVLIMTGAESARIEKTKESRPENPAMAKFTFKMK